MSASRNIPSSALLELTAQSERERLDTCLIATIKNLFHPQDVRLYELFDNSGTVEFGPENVYSARARDRLAKHDRTTFAITECQRYLQCIERSEVIIERHSDTTIACHPERGRHATTRRTGH